MITKNVIQKIISQDNTEKNIPLAKMDRNIIRDIAKNSIRVERSTMDLLFHISPYVDIDRRINISLQELQTEMNYRKSTFDFALHQAIQLELITKKEGYYYSNYHITSRGEGGRYKYVPNLSLLTSPEFKNYTLNQKRLFLYFLTSSPPGFKNTILIRNLYKNSLHSKNVGVNYFKNYREVINALIKMVENKHIELIITKSNITRSFKANKTTCSNMREDILDFLEITELDQITTKKKWIYQAEKRDFKISARILYNGFEDLKIVEASKKEVEQLGREFNVPLYHISDKVWKFVIAYKNQIYLKSGSLGLDIYRESLKRFFNDNAPMIEYYIKNEKMANYFMDFYLLKDCMKHITSCTEKFFVTNLSNCSLKLEKSRTLQDMRNLLSFVNEKTAKQDLLIFQHELLNLPGIEDSILEKSLNVEWLSFKKNVNNFIHKNYLTHVVHRELHISLPQYENILLEVLKENRGKEKEYMNKILAELELTLKKSKSETEILNTIYTYSHSLDIVKNASSNGQSYKKENDSIEKLPFYNWLKRRE